MRSMKFLNKIDYSLAAAVIFCVLINIPYLVPSFMIGHDTKACFISFHYFYNHVLQYGEIPYWLPYSGYGQNSIWYLIINFSPSTYLVAFIGWLSNTHDSLLLFKLSAVFDQLLFVLGLHLFSKRIYRCFYTRFTICIAGVGSVIWYWQIYFDLRLFYLIPLILYFYHKFLVDRQAWAFWATLVTMLMNMLGGVPYWAPVYLFLFLVLNAVLVPVYWRSFSCIARPDWKSFCGMGLFAVGAMSLTYIYMHCFDGVQNYSSGRSPDSLSTDLKTFLTYSPPLWGILHSFIDGIRPDPMFNRFRPDDLRLYIGLLPLAAVPVAIYKSRDKWFYALIAMFICTVLLAGSGFSSWLLYWTFPGMSKYRHLSLLLELAKILLLFVSGFGIQILFDKFANLSWLKLYFKLPHFLMLLACLIFILDMIIADNVHDDIWVSPMEIESLLPVGGAWIVLRLICWSIFLLLAFLLPRLKYDKSAAFSKTVLPMCLVATCAIDSYTFQINRLSVAPQASHVVNLKIEPLEFHGMRRMGYKESHTSLDEILRTHAGDTIESYFTNAYQDSTCLPIGRVDLFSQGVHNLMTQRGLPLSEVKNDFSQISLDDPEFKRVLGCESSKIRIVPNALYAQTDSEIGNYINDFQDIDYMVPLRGTAPADTPEQLNMPYSPEYTVKGFNANQLDIEVDVKPGQSGWLVYADSFSPLWKASINGVNVPIYEAYLAFKAVFVNEGRNRIVFEYKNTLQHYAISYLVSIGILFAICSLGFIVRLLWKGNE